MAGKLKNGYVHIYTGPGKGKTTASMGLGLRAASSGLRVCMFQFLKKRGSSSDNRVLIPNFKVVCFDQVHPMFSKVSKETLKRKILKDLKKVKTVLRSKRYDVVILDEAINCVSEKFVEEAKISDLIKAKPKCVELVLTGRGLGRKLASCADYVTRFDKVKHPFDKGILARRGIEF